MYGFYNKRNTCWLATVLHVLTAIHSIDTWLFPDINENDIKIQVQLQINKMHIAKQTLDEPVTLKNSLAKQFKEYKFDHQQDPMELITRLFLYLGNGPFEFQIKETTVCLTCSYQITKYNLNNHYKYTFNSDDNSMTRLIQTMKEDNNTRQSRCQNCHNQERNLSTGEQHLVKTVISEYPSTLLIHLGRFTSTLIKNETAFTYSETVTINNTRYELRSIICHYGKLINNGHFIAIKKNNNANQFFSFNNEKVAVCPDVTNFKNEVCLLMYEKIL